MKIRRDEIDGEQKIITPCGECLFFQGGTCLLGRLAKYKEKGQTQQGGSGTPEILTFCNHARPEAWQKLDETLQDCIRRTQKDNELKYTLILRINDAEDLLKAIPLTERSIKPEHLVISFEDVDIARTVEIADDLGCSFELLKITDMDAQANSEMGRIFTPWSETIDLTKEFCCELMDKFNRMINDDLEQIVAVVGEQYIVMTMLAASLETIGIDFNLNNIEEIANIQGTTKNIRRFDGHSICNYS